MPHQTFSRQLGKLERDIAELRNSVGPRRFLPPMSGEAVAALEVELGTNLTEAHRAILTRVTAGEEDRGNTMLLSPRDGLAVLPAGARPKNPFPFDDADAEVLIAGAAANRWGTAPCRPGSMDGVLPVVDHGDGTYDCVVLFGPQRGRVWQYSDPGWMPRFRLVKKKPVPIDVLSLVSGHLKGAKAELPKIDPTARVIDLTGLGLPGIPPKVFEATGLERLSLSGNPIGRLPERLFDLSSLTELVVGAAGLTTVTPAIARLSNLVVLALRANRIRTLPAEIGNLGKLKHLDLGNNRVASLPDTVGELSSLEVLRLADNQLAELPSTISRLTELRDLEIENNPLRCLPTGFQELPVEGLTLEGMPKLDFERTFDVLARMPRLTTLAVRGPCTAPPERWRELTGLATLRLVRLGLTQVPRGIADLPALKTLSLDQNRIESLPDFIGQMPSLEKVILFANPLDVAYVNDLRARWPHLVLEFFG